jgi:hypothetical protein
MPARSSLANTVAMPVKNHRIRWVSPMCLILVVAACGSTGGSGGPAASGGKVCSPGSGPQICIDKATFDPGESIAVSFQGGEGELKDWIAVYRDGACSPTCPSPSVLWQYCNSDTHTAGATGVTSGSVVIDSTANSGNWPLGGGNYDLVYLVNDAYSPIATLAFTVTGTSTSPTTGGTCPIIGSCGPSANDCKCGLSCLHVGEGSYKCSDSCSTASDCANATNPTTGTPWSSCEPPHTGALGLSYEGYCY